MNKRKLILIGIGVLIGIGIYLVANLLNLSPLIMYAIAFAIVFIAIAINYALYGKYVYKMMQIMKLFDAGDYTTYVNKMEECLLASQKSKREKIPNMIRINLSAGYSELFEYEKGLKVLEEVTSLDLEKTFLLVYKINLCSMKFKLGQKADATKLYEENLELFNENKDDLNFGGSIGLLNANYFLVKENKKKARAILSETRKKFTNPRLVKHFDELAKEIN